MSEPRPLAFVGGRILTMDPWHADPEVVVVEHGRIVAVGARALLEGYPTAVVEDLAGRTLLPGLIDAHNHLCIAALHPRWADLSQAATLDDIGRLLREQAAREPDARWVRGCDWDARTAGVYLTRGELDAFGIDRPVIVSHFSYHQCVVSSRGLDELGIGRTTPDPEGGLIDRGRDGQPTGLLVERAWSEAHARSLADYADPERWGELIVARARTHLADGITCVHDAACPPSAEAVYRRLAAERALPIAILAMPHAEDILAPVPRSRLDGPVTGEGDEWFRVGAVKVFGDGGVLPAIDVVVHGERQSHGSVLPDVEAQVERAVAAGFRVAVHAMGNVGLTATLDAFAQALRAYPDVEHRFRVEHGTLASRDQLARMAELGAVAVVQPGFVRVMGGMVAAFPPEREVWLPFGDMVRAGVPIAASSDSPCAIHAPLITSACGVTRKTDGVLRVSPEQSLDYETWLDAYTAGAAYAGGQEHERGTLTPGKRADLVVLEGALDAENPPHVVQTWVAGKREY